MMFLAAAVLAVPLSAMGYPTPAQAGFHHCALIYERPERGPGDLAPYVARRVGGRARQWMFDAFLFMRFTAPSGARTDSGPTAMADWQAQLDEWFSPGRDLSALDAAIEAAARDLGQPPAPRQVVLTIPYTNRSVRSFGDVDGDGRAEDLSTPEGRAAVLAWYVAEGRRRFAAAGFRHLRLWGFYWMAEGVSRDDESLVSAAAERVHAAGLRLLWIPWYRAPGFERWRQMGFDVAILQPNYAFYSSNHRGAVRRNRLPVTADLARDAGLGIEVEAGALTTSAADRQAFLQYLADGSAKAPRGTGWPWGGLGYQDGATAYYLGTDMVEQTSTSADPAVRRTYEALADYVGGKQVPDPGPALRWRNGRTTSDGRSAGVRVLEAALPPATRVGAVDIWLDEPGAIWPGLVEVQARESAGASWRAAGWSLRPGHELLDGRRQALTVPVDCTTKDLRVVLRSRGQRQPTVAGISAWCVPTDGAIRHLAFGCPYTCSPAPKGTYGDDGTKLTDGIVPETGFASGRTVGWYGGRVAVSFDLGRVVPVSGVELCCEGGSYAAVNWPSQAVALLSAGGRPPTSFGGVGAPPPGFVWLPGGSPVVDRSRSTTDLDGHYTFAPPRAIPTRYVTLVLQANGWLMLSEVRILSGGVNVAPRGRYRLRPLPTGPTGHGPSYEDDGVRLTDGEVARSFAPQAVTGFIDDRVHEYTVDLGVEQPVREVVAWCLGGGEAGIVAPRRVSAAYSRDGTTWSADQDAAVPRMAEDGKRCEAVACRAKAAGGPARYVRVRVQRGGGWAMISEIEVR